MLEHCAHSIECSLSGYPAMKPAIVRATVGPLVLRLFLARGRMSHDREAPLPGAARTPGAGLAEAQARFRRAVEAFQAHRGPLADHFVYGRCTREQYDRVHALHVMDHLSAVRPALS